MAATTSTTHGTKRYFNLISGKFAEKATKETPNAVHRKNKKLEDVYELLYDKINGKVQDIVIEESDFGSQLRFGLNDGFETCIITIPCESKLFRHFIQKIENADLSKEVELCPYNFTGKDGNKVSGMNIYQNGIKLGYAELKGMPKVPTGTQLDKDDYEIHRKQETKFLKAYVKSKYVGTTPPTVSGSLPPNKGFENEKAVANTGAGASDDLPF